MIDWRNSVPNRPELYADSNDIRALVRPIYHRYLVSRDQPGKRAVNKNDWGAYFKHLTNIILDLYQTWNTDPELWIGYSRSKRAYSKGGRYWDWQRNEPVISHTLYVGLIDYLIETNYIEHVTAKPGRNRYSSRMRAADKLIQLFDPELINWASIKVDHSISAIIVKDEEKNIIPPPDPGEFDVAQCQANLRRINENLEWSLLNIHITDAEYASLKRHRATELEDEDTGTRTNAINFSRRYLRRVFANSSYEFGGRFYGGWWQGVPSRFRKHIEIEGCITREMDFSTIQPRILYARKNTEPPEDSYKLDGWDTGLRPIIKKAFNQLINSRPGSRNENQWHRFAPSMPLDDIPDGWETMKKHQRAEVHRNEFIRVTGREYRELLTDLKELHEPIDEFFFSQSWGWLQRIDSDIAEDVMLKLLDDQHTSLPIHDSFIVRMGAEQPLLNAMNEAFERRVGVQCNIDPQEAIYDPPLDYEHRPGGVALDDLVEEAIEDGDEASQYHIREAEWRRVWGLVGYE